MSNEVNVDAESIKKSAEDLVELIKLRTFPFGMKLFENVDDMLSIKGRTPSDGKFFTTCQLVTQVRTAGFTLGIVQNNLRPGSSCGANIGLEVVPEDVSSGQKMTGVWFENQEVAAKHQAQMPRVEAGKYRACCVSFKDWTFRPTGHMPFMLPGPNDFIYQRASIS